MIYSIGDQFVVAGVECKVAYINRGLAWVVPTHPGSIYKNIELLTGLAFARLNKKGLTEYGERAIPIVKADCAAV